MSIGLKTGARRAPIGRHDSRLLDLVLLGVPDRVTREIEHVAHTVGRCQMTDAKSLLSVLVGMQQAICVVGVPDRTDPRMVDCVRRIRDGFPRVGLLAVFLPDWSSHEQLLRIGAEGVNDVLVYQPEGIAEQIRERLRCVARDSVAFQLGRSCEKILPDAWVTLFKAALRLAHAPISLDRFAASAGMHERTLRKYCQRVGMPSPQWVIGWARLLTAAYYLGEHGRTLATIAEMLGYASTSALQNQLRRYTGRGPRELRSTGAQDALLAELAALAASTSRQGDSERPLLRLLR